MEEKKTNHRNVSKATLTESYNETKKVRLSDQQQIPDTKSAKVKEEKNEVEESKKEPAFEDKLVQLIIGIALESVDGLLTVDGNFFSHVADKLDKKDDPTSGIDVGVEKDQVVVDLDIIAEYGTNIEKLYQQIKKVIVEEVARMTSLKVSEVNVRVLAVKTKEQHRKDSEALQKQKQSKES